MGEREAYTPRDTHHGRQGGMYTPLHTQGGIQQGTQGGIRQGTQGGIGRLSGASRTLRTVV